jgi:biopolymer transport protein ExbB
MQWNWQEMWSHMGIPALVVAGVLATMGFASLLVFIERMILFARSSAQGRRFLREAAPALGEGRLETVAEVASQYPGCPMARVVAGAVQTHLQSLAQLGSGSLSPVEKTLRHTERHLEQVGAELRRGFSVLAAVGSTAPFVGLLGTVLGIITAFQGIAESGSSGLAAVSAGIAEALVETALGLVVAIPAVLAFNFLTSRANAEEARLKNVVGEVLDRIEDVSGGIEVRSRAEAQEENTSPNHRRSWSGYPASLEVAG